MKKIYLTISFIISTTIIIAQTSNIDSLAYLNQESPGLTPKVFAPNIISKINEYEFGSAFTKAGDEFYYAVRLNDDWEAEIRYTKLQNGKWTKPEKLKIDDTYSYNDPFLSKNEDKLYFISNRPLNGQGDKKDSDLWYIQKNDKGWSDPINLGNAINTAKDEYYISFTDSERIYFVSNIHTTEEDKWNFDVYYAESSDGEFKAPVRMGDEINSEYFECDPFISPDESYIIFCSSRSGGYGQGDLYISFKNDKNEWSKAKNMGDVFNTESHEFCPIVTKDGKYFFYTSNGNIYWVSAKVIDELREEY